MITLKSFIIGWKEQNVLNLFLKNKWYLPFPLRKLLKTPPTPQIIHVFQFKNYPSFLLFISSSFYFSDLIMQVYARLQDLNQYIKRSKLL